jgi:hypothetical protein
VVADERNHFVDPEIVALECNHPDFASEESDRCGGNPY